MRDLLLENGIPDGGDPLVDKVYHSALAGDDELFVLSGRLYPISANGVKDQTRTKERWVRLQTRLEGELAKEGEEINNNCDGKKEQR